MALSQKEADIQMMLAASCHLGTKNCDYQMERYVWRRRTDGIYVINLAKTWDKLQLAARVLVAVENPQDIVVQSARPYGQRAVLKFGQYTGANAMSGRHTPGTYTNHEQGEFNEPRVMLLTDPRTDAQPISEAQYMNVVTIAFCDTDSPLQGVDVAIPANNKGKHSIGVMYYLLCRMILQMRATVTPERPWDVMVDMFFYREPEEIEEEEAKEAAGYNKDAAFAAAPAALAAPAMVPDWDESAAMGAFDPAMGAVPAAAEWQQGAVPAGFDPAAPPMQPVDPTQGYVMPPQQMDPTGFGAQY